MIAYVFFALVVAKAAAYWIGSAIQLPHEPLSTIVLYRGKDIETFPIMRNLAHLRFGEPSLFEGSNNGVLSERFVPWVLHAFLFRFLGASGFIVADLLITPLHFLLFTLLLRLCGVKRTLSLATSAVLTCAATTDFGELWLGHSIPRFWGLRLPRPYVSELFLLVCVAGTVSALNDLRQGKVRYRSWIAAGAGLALLAQSDFYSAAALGLAFVGLFITLWFRNHQRTLLLRGCAIAAVTVAAFSLPGAIQSRLMNPESMVRLGLFPISRLHPPFITVPAWYAGTLILLVLSWVLARQNKGGPSVELMHQRTGRTVLLAACVAALITLPLSTIALGKNIELYHYRDTFVRLFSLALLLVTLHTGQALWTNWGTRRLRPSAALTRWSIVLPAALVCVAFIWRQGSANPRRSDHMRSDFDEWAALHDYRTPFVDLVGELSKPRYDGHLVLGTFDHQVWSWWLTFRGGYSYLADACTSNVENAELERRPAQLARLIGMTREQFLDFARRRYVMIFWMSCSKYQANRAYAFAPLADYSAIDRRQIQNTPDFLNFAVALPLSQQARLGNVFDGLNRGEMARLDIIVLTRDQSLEGFAPQANQFEKTFENRLFAVWQRR